jgi:Concanavalin A-like lectin/glucanases superfamily/PEP-CTERM motif
MRRHRSLGLVAAGFAASLSLATLLGAAPITFANAVLADSPIAYWRFGEAPGATTASDSAIGHDGTYSAVGIALGQAGIGGGDTGALFDGATGRGTVPDDAELGPDTITMEALLRWDGPNGFQQRVLEKSFFAGGEQASYGLSILPDGTIRVEIRAGGGPSSHTTSTAITAGSNAHVAATFDGTSVVVYLNGALVLDELAATPGNLQDGINPLGIGNQFERDRPFLGLIDELALYDHALSAGQIGEHFGALSPVPEPGTVLLLLSGLGLVGGALRRTARARS